MTSLKVTAKGQVTLKKDVLRHLGIEPGQQLEVDLLPGGMARIHAPRPRTSWDAIAGMLHDPHRKAVSIAELDAAIASTVASLDDIEP